MYFGASAQYGQIQNGGFENWTTTTLYDYLNDWKDSNRDNNFFGTPTVFKSSDAQLGAYSAEVTSQLVGTDTVFGYVFQGTIGDSGPESGVPYSSTFNKVQFQYKSDLPVGDSLFVIIVRYEAGAMVEMIVEPVVSGVQSTWTQGSLSISSTTQDSLFLAFIAGDPFNNLYLTPGAWARIDNVQLLNGTTAQPNLPDFSFENWTPQVVESADNWYSYNEVLAAFDLENANKTTDANSGTYAIEMTTVELTQYGDTIPSFLSFSPIIDGFEAVPYVASPTTFSGSYKYSPTGSDEASIQIYFMQNGAYIGNLTETLTAQSNYTAFSSPITIVGIPDSILFVVSSGDSLGSILKLDDLSFSGGNVGLAEFAQMSSSIYPNPASSIVMIKSEGAYAFELVNITGEVVISNANLCGVQEINIEDVIPGTYFVRLTNGTTTAIHKLIVQ